MAEERRKEPRYPVEMFVDVTALVRDQRVPLGRCVLHDVSASGACIHSYCPLPFGTLVELHADKFHLTGRIRNCNRTGSEFRIGLALASVHFPSSTATDDSGNAMQDCDLPVPVIQA
jgi:hypothetical protein